MDKRIIKSIKKEELMRYLGMYFNSHLSFTDYLTKIASKRQRVVTYLSILVKTTKEIEIGIIQRIVYAYILPILTYRTLV